MARFKIILSSFIFFACFTERSFACDMQDVDTARKDIQAKLKANQEGLAADSFLKFQSKCSVSRAKENVFKISASSDASKPSIQITKEQIVEYYWLQSDGLLALLKADRLSQCVSEGLRVTGPSLNSGYIDLGLDTSPVGKELTTNLSNCRAQWEKGFAKVDVEKCALKLDHRAGTAYKVPKGLLPKGTEADCIQWVSDVDAKATRDEKEAEEVEPRIYPHIRLIQKKPEKPELTYSLLKMEQDMNAINLGVCDLDKFLILKQKNKTLLRISGQWTPCLGGTGRGELDMVLEISDKGLKVVDAISAVYH